MSRRASGRVVMLDHHLSARVWATAALLAAPLHGSTALGWWLPLHLALAGAASQLIVGGQLMFSATFARARAPRRGTVLGQLALLNAGAAGIALGRLTSRLLLVGLAAGCFVAGVGWSALVVRRLWRSSLDRRFRLVGTFYGLASASVIVGASAGGAMGIGVVGPESYVGHRLMHMGLNLFGWAGLTILGTAVTLLPTMLRVRAPAIGLLRAMPWTAIGGLLVVVTGLTTGRRDVATIGGVALAGSLVPFAWLVRRVLAVPRRRRVPVSAVHLLAALGWLGVVALVQIPVLAAGRLDVVRDLWVVGLAAGCVFQAIVGAWSFLLPAARAVLPESRRLELVAFELGALPQAVAYNAGLALVLASLRGLVPGAAGGAGLGLVLAAIAWALAKCWAFALLARLPVVAARSVEWWAPVAASAARSGS